MEEIRRERHVGDARDPDRLAVVEGLELGKLLEVREDQVADPPDQLAAVGRRHPAPRPVFEGAPRGANGAVDVLGLTPRNLGEHLAGRRVDRLEGSAGCRLDPLTADQQPLGLCRKVRNPPL